jgi:uncharacterized damage-inducible protein DinB
MIQAATPVDRRNFLRASAVLTAGMLSLPETPVEAHSLSKGNELLVIGPMEGYSPLIGTLVSMLNYNRQTVIDAVESLTKEQLDYLHDDKANTIGALVLHLGATDKFYQINSFEGRQDFTNAEKRIWDVPMNLGEQARATIKGHDAAYYLDIIGEVRQQTLEQLKKKDDAWLLALDPVWSKQRPVNTYWKWFHVCEHEANHRGQIVWLRGRLPGAKPGKD